jgi:hypothetical protein
MGERVTWSRSDPMNLAMPFKAWASSHTKSLRRVSDGCIAKVVIQPSLTEAQDAGYAPCRALKDTAKFTLPLRGNTARSTHTKC